MFKWWRRLFGRRRKQKNEALERSSSAPPSSTPISEPQPFPAPKSTKSTSPPVPGKPPWNSRSGGGGGAVPSSGRALLSEDDINEDIESALMGSAYNSKGKGPAANGHTPWSPSAPPRRMDGGGRQGHVVINGEVQSGSSRLPPPMNNELKQHSFGATSKRQECATPDVEETTTFDLLKGSRNGPKPLSSDNLAHLPANGGVKGGRGGNMIDVDRFVSTELLGGDSSANTTATSLDLGALHHGESSDNHRVRFANVSSEGSEKERFLNLSVETPSIVLSNGEKVIPVGNSKVAPDDPSKVPTLPRVSFAKSVAVLHSPHMPVVDPTAYDSTSNETDSPRHSAKAFTTMEDDGLPDWAKDLHVLIGMYLLESPTATIKKGGDLLPKLLTAFSPDVAVEAREWIQNGTAQRRQGGGSNNSSLAKGNGSPRGLLAANPTVLGASPSETIASFGSAGSLSSVDLWVDSLMEVASLLRDAVDVVLSPLVSKLEEELTHSGHSWADVEISTLHSILCQLCEDLYGESLQMDCSDDVASEGSLPVFLGAVTEIQSEIFDAFSSAIGDSPSNSSSAVRSFATAAFHGVRQFPQSDTLSMLCRFCGIVFTRQVTLEHPSIIEQRSRDVRCLLGSLGLLLSDIATMLDGNSKGMFIYHQTSVEGCKKVTLKVSRENAFIDSMKHVEMLGVVPSGGDSKSQKQQYFKVFPFFTESSNTNASHGSRAVESGEGHGPRKEFFSLCGQGMVKTLTEATPVPGAVASGTSSLSSPTSMSPGGANTKVVGRGFDGLATGLVITLHNPGNPKESISRTILNIHSDAILYVDSPFPHAFQDWSVSVQQRVQPLFVFNRSTGAYWYNVNLPRSKEKEREYFHAGWLMGQIFSNRASLGVRFSPMLGFKILHSGTFEPTLTHLEWFDSEMTKTIRNVQKLNASQFHDLVEAEGLDGSATPRSYIDSVVTDVLLDSVEWQSTALRAGFFASVPPLILEQWKIRAEDLSVIISGNTSDDSEDFRISECFQIVLDDELLTDEGSILSHCLWSVVESWPPSKKRQFLHFVTGSDRLPLPQSEVLKVELPFVAYGVQEQKNILGFLPQSHTCENILEIPNYWEALVAVHEEELDDGGEEDNDDHARLKERLREILDDRLTVAIENAGGYGLDDVVAPPTARGRNFGQEQHDGIEEDAFPAAADGAEFDSLQDTVDSIPMLPHESTVESIPDLGETDVAEVEAFGHDDNLSDDGW